MRRILLTVGAAIVVVAAALTGAAGVHALWGVERSLQAGITTTGDFGVSATWVNGPPAAATLFPGEHTPDATIRVAQSGSGTTLGWRLNISSAVDDSELAPYITFQAWVGACETGVSVPAGGYPATGHLTQNTNVDLCVRHTLAENAPTSLQDAVFDPTITVLGEQAGG